MKQPYDDFPDYGFPCSECKKTIPDGTPMWSINLQYETFVEGAITVHEANSVFIFCKECADTKDFSKITVSVKE